MNYQTKKKPHKCSPSLSLGAASLVWVVLWLIMYSPRPDCHPYISHTELDYIVRHRTGLGGQSDQVKQQFMYDFRWN